MIKLEHVVLASPEQMNFIIQGLRNPLNSWDKSDSGIGCFKYGHDEDYVDCNSCSYSYGFCRGNHYAIGPNDHDLMQRLSNAGTEHRKYLRMMPVYVRITAPLYW